MRILAVGAHPDDLEILCGGTLAEFKARGDEVAMCHIARGDRGSYDSTREEMTTVRRQEAAESAGIIGAQHFSLEFPDGEICGTDAEQRRKMVEVIRRVRPDLVLTHWPHDYMGDHNQTSQLVEDSSFLATLPLYETDLPATAKVPALVYMDTISGNGFVPTEFVDISASIEAKLSMMSRHQSQLIWLSEHDGVDMLENLRISARYRGLQCGVEFAEGFVVSNVHLRARAHRLLP